jgi:hypothetical protein
VEDMKTMKNKLVVGLGCKIICLAIIGLFFVSIISQNALAATCTNCSGSGDINSTCSSCSGTGDISSTCNSCYGTGDISSTCNSCYGTGSISQDYSFTEVSEDAWMSGIINKYCNVDVTVLNNENSAGTFILQVTAYDDDGGTYYGSKSEAISGGTMKKISVVVDVPGNLFSSSTFRYTATIEAPTKSVTCSGCGGDGEKLTSCSTCGGDGTKTTSCSACGGDGTKTTSCSTCSGDGIIDESSTHEEDSSTPGFDLPIIAIAAVIGVGIFAVMRRRSQ